MWTHLSSFNFGSTQTYKCFICVKHLKIITSRQPVEKISDWLRFNPRKQLSIHIHSLSKGMNIVKIKLKIWFFGKCHINIIRAVPMMKRGPLLANVLRFFSRDVIDQYASERNMNFSLSLFTVWDLPNGFLLSFSFYILLQNLCSWLIYP